MEQNKEIAELESLIAYQKHCREKAQAKWERELENHECQHQGDIGKIHRRYGVVLATCLFMSPFILSCIL